MNEYKFFLVLRSNEIKAVLMSAWGIPEPTCDSDTVIEITSKTYVDLVLKGV